MCSPKVHVVEVNLISAQDLKPVGITKRMTTYAVAWIDPEKKLRSCIDTVGRTNPTWNDKFLFAIDAERDYRSSNSALEIDIYCVRRLRKDKRIGVVRVMLDQLVNSKGMEGKCMAFQIWRPSSGTPRGILNLGVAAVGDLFKQQANGLVGSSSMALDHRVLMGKEVMKDFSTVDQKKISEVVLKKEGLIVLSDGKVYLWIKVIFQ